ncbi:MAG: 5-(carboxyamino)imidazole ribonucleotide synthase [Asticcacaulis sp.]|uniref:5-(carboxyamino)imidazole ribonucleotide synthase n=1 Tax=Asticcacaulis sp. TaxID=1872648 RepID=UPI003F7B6019
MLNAPLPLGATIGMLGDGQLGRMLSLAASRLGFKTAVFGPEDGAPAAQVSASAIVASYDDEDALRRFAASCDVITLEFENIPAATLEFLTGLGKVVAPGAHALRITQDRVLEKTFAREQGVATVDFRAVDTLDDLKAALAALGTPSLLKTRRDGYDGKGQVWIRDASEAEAAFNAVGGKPSILEAKASFTREISVVAARGWNGEMRAFPIGENHHVNGILSTTLAPAPVSDDVTKAAHDIARRVLQGLDYIGVLAVELFVLDGDVLVLNEIAPRVHNSGHWTQEGCVCDQFEQHIRAVTGWPLGDPSARCTVEMTNLLGDDILDWPRLAAEPQAQLHVYGKAEPRPGRKMGHINRIKS